VPPVKALRKLLAGTQDAKPAPYPGLVEFCHPTPRPKLPTGARWQYEIKFDGYRVQLHRNGEKAFAFTRNCLDCSEQFTPLCQAALDIPASSLVLDGEMVAPGQNGIGYVPAKPNSIAAIRLARREAGGLVYAGKAGTGFTMKSAQDVRKRIEPLMRRSPPTAKTPREKDTVWVEPKVSARIEFRGVTEDGMMRHPSFKGLISE
jgi:ATP-dependent DNA ligase